MRGKRPVLEIVRNVMWRGIAVMIIAVFAGYALFGANGVLAWGDYSQRLGTRQQDLAALQQSRDVLANRVKLLDPQKADPDMVDELVRKDLGLAQPDEVIIPLD
jgi:cell division protein FtsB